MRLIGEPAKSRRKAASSRAARAARRGAVSASRGPKSGSCAASANLFHGQTARQSSQPKMRLPIERAQFDRDHPFVFDRQIGDAAARVELVGRREGGGRAGVEAAAAGAAVIALCRVGFERQAQKNLAEKQPGAEIPRHQIGVLALPAEPGARRQRFFHDRGGVDKELQRARPLRLNPKCQRLEAPLQRVVIVAAAGIDRNDAAVPAVGERRRVVGRGIVDAEHDDALRLGPEGAWIAAARGGPGEPAHVAVIAARKKFLESGARRRDRAGLRQSRRHRSPRRAPDRGSPRGSMPPSPRAQPRPR